MYIVIIFLTCTAFTLHYVYPSEEVGHALSAVKNYVAMCSEISSGID